MAGAGGRRACLLCFIFFSAPLLLSCDSRSSTPHPASKSGAAHDEAKFADLLKIMEANEKQLEAFAQDVESEEPETKKFPDRIRRIRGNLEQAKRVNLLQGKERESELQEEFDVAIRSMNELLKESGKLSGSELLESVQGVCSRCHESFGDKHDQAE